MISVTSVWTVNQVQEDYLVISMNEFQLCILFETNNKVIKSSIYSSFVSSSIHRSLDLHR